MVGQETEEDTKFHSAWQCWEEVTLRDIGPLSSLHPDNGTFIHGEILAILPVTSSLAAFLGNFIAGSAADWNTGMKAIGQLCLVPLWIDAVCIDQENQAEKTQSILHMGEIYARAFRVIVWLGQETPKVDGCLQLVNRLHTLMVALQDPDWKGTDYDRDKVIKLLISRKLWEGAFWWEHLVFSADTEFSASKWLGFWFDYVYKRRRWFRRGWVVQEVCLATAPIVMCGTRLMEWSELVAVDDALWSMALGKHGIGKAWHWESLATVTETLYGLSLDHNNHIQVLQELRSHVRYEIMAARGDGTGSGRDVSRLSAAKSAHTLRTWHAALSAWRPSAIQLWPNRVP